MLLCGLELATVLSLAFTLDTLSTEVFLPLMQLMCQFSLAPVLDCWVVQMGLLTPLTFTRHCLSALFLLLVHTFFPVEGGDSEFTKFTVPASKACSKACNQRVSGNKQELTASATGYRKMLSFLHASLHSRSVQPGDDAETLVFHPPTPFPCNSCKHNSRVICTASQVKVQLPLLYTVENNTYSEISPEVAVVTFHNFLHRRLQRAFTHANQLY